MKPIPYGRQEINDDDINAVIEVLKSDYLTQGPAVEKFESEFASYIGCKYAVAVANGTAALHLSSLALGVNETSKVITTPITFAASANCILYCGGKVDFVDIDSETALIDLNKVEDLLKKSKQGLYQGIIPVDFAGYPVNLEELKQIADKHNLWILEDACHAPGGAFLDSKGLIQKCGNSDFSDISIFSFHPVKHIATGEGGMITTNNEFLYKKLLLLRTHGITKNPLLMNENHGGWYYEMQELGYNYRLSDIHAALGSSQLKRANENLERRRHIAERYDQAFENSKIKIIKPKESFFHAYHLYIIQIQKRNELYEVLKENNIYPQVHYIPVHTMPYYKSLGWKKGDFPLAESYYENCLSIPMYPTLSKEDQEKVINIILNFE